ncbi:MAG: carboxypeptidase regulatory-like domain-containing protein [Candidatus Andersenbacteria bacterium]|nr:carboxypeptidase regulatory-like domain-containing protein [Candidatus Andersenbacteria bacterium]MBI3250949.1 carboxypeptidase regulatory-like domain-containing protein [Candidatus Andersenbacteria bacterium]
MNGSRGFTIIEIVITTFLIGTVVVGVFGLFLLSLRSAQESERRVVAVALANERMEMVRNLPYVNVGTSGGIPTGPILQIETVARNGLDYLVKTDIRYVDDEYDGKAAAPTEEDDHITICHRPGTQSENTLTISSQAWPAHQAHGDYQGECGNPDDGTGDGDEYNADYKQVRVEVSWTSPSNPSPVLFITYIAPPGIEGGELGGTLDLQVIDAAGVGVPSAQVVLINDDTSPAINLTTQTDSDGRLILPGLPEEADSYALAISKAGYTSEQTYDSSASFVPDADHGHLSMILKALTSKTFSIDETASLIVNTKDATATAVPDIAYTLRGTKTIGTDGSGNPVYVLDETAATNSAGTHTHSALVWDSYNFQVDGETSGYDIKETSLLLPLVVLPGDDLTLDVTLVEHTPLSLHVTVANSEGLPIDNATVTLTKNPTFTEEQGTGVLGQVFFADLPTTATYTLTVDAPGFTSSSQQVPVDESERIRVQLSTP